MISEFAPAKINLALHVLGRRDDGYHDLDSIVGFADVGDTIEIRAATEFSIAARGPFAAGLPPADQNIMHAAWRLAQQIAQSRGRVVPAVAINIEKNLPVASGIGGGSADAAATLRGCLRLAGLAIDRGAYEAALTLGADVPVCLLRRAARMRGIGEHLAPFETFAALPAVLVNPAVPVATKDVFTALGLRRGQSHRAAIDPERPLSELRNDMQEAAIAVAPAIAGVLAALAAQPGCRLARMSGSGATCFGIFDVPPAARAAAARISEANPDWWTRPAVIG